MVNGILIIVKKLWRKIYNSCTFFFYRFNSEEKKKKSIEQNWAALTFFFFPAVIVASSPESNQGLFSQALFVIVRQQRAGDSSFRRLVRWRALRVVACRNICILN